MEIVTLREFARRLNVSLTAIQKGEKTGRVKAIRDKATGKLTGIDWDTQAQAWEDNCKAPQRRAINQAGGRTRLDGKPVAAPKTGPKPQAKAASIEKPTTATGMTMADAQRARELVKLQLDNLKLKEAQGELVRADEVRSEMGKLAAMVKSGLMNIPDRIASELAGMTDPHEIHTVIANEIIAAMEELCRKANV